jgi:hypothetical protein
MSVASLVVGTAGIEVAARREVFPSKAEWLAYLTTWDLMALNCPEAEALFGLAELGQERQAKLTMIE